MFLLIEINRNIKHTSDADTRDWFWNSGAALRDYEVPHYTKYQLVHNVPLTKHSEAMIEWSKCCFHGAAQSLCISLTRGRTDRLLQTKFRWINLRSLLCCFSHPAHSEDSAPVKTLTAECLSWTRSLWIWTLFKLKGAFVKSSDQPPLSSVMEKVTLSALRSSPHVWNVCESEFTGQFMSLHSFHISLSLKHAVVV